MGSREEISNSWLVIVNPNAGNKKGKKDWPTIKNKLEKHGFNFHAVFTEQRNHAVSLTARMIGEGYRKIMVVGGDGTLNEVANGIFNQKDCPPEDMLIGMIPVGTGNDWGRTYNIPKKYGKAIKVISKENTFTQDVGYVEYHDDDGAHERYFVNVSGMGYDALVAEKTNRMKDRGRGGTLAYFLNIFTGLFQYKYTPFKISVDDKEVFSGRVLSMNIGICKYNGGGLMQLPSAIPDDGLIDITVIKAISRLKIIQNVAKLYDGSFVKLNFVSTFRGKTCTVVSRPEGRVLLEADGETLGHSPLHFSIREKALRFIIPYSGPD